MREDDGSIYHGIMFVIGCACCLVIGYLVRDSGIVIDLRSQSAPIEQNYPQGR